MTKRFLNLKLLLVLMLACPFVSNANGILGIIEMVKNNNKNNFLPLRKEELRNETTHKTMSYYGNNFTIVYDYPHYKGSLISLDPEDKNSLNNIKDHLCSYLGSRNGTIIYQEKGELNKIQQNATTVVDFHIDSKKNLSPRRVKSKIYIKKVVCETSDYTNSFYLKRIFLEPRNESSAQNQRLISKINFPHHFIKGVPYFFSSASNKKIICQLFGMSDVYKSSSHSGLILSPSSDKRPQNILVKYVDGIEERGLHYDLSKDQKFIKSITCQKYLNN